MSNVNTNARPVARRVWLKPEVRQIAASTAEVSTRNRNDGAFSYS